MVMSAKVLGTDEPCGGAAAAAFYFAGKYYANGNDPPGQWIGGGIPLLGLKDPPTYETLLALFSGSHPLTLKPLVRIPRRIRKPDNPPVQGDAPRSKKRRDRCPGIDCCVTMWPDLKTVWAVAPEWKRKEIEGGFEAAAKAWLSHVEKELPLARLGKDGAVREPAKLVAAMFQHLTSRATGIEPHPHLHIVIANLAARSTGWGCIDTKLLLDWVRAYGPLFRCILSAELSRRLDLPLAPALDENGEALGWPVIPGIPDAVRKLWATRSKEIDEFLTGEIEGGGGATAKARAIAQERTRAAKTADPAERGTFREVEKGGGAARVWRKGARSSLKPTHVQGTGSVPRRPPCRDGRPPPVGFVFHATKAFRAALRTAEPHGDRRNCHRRSVKDRPWPVARDHSPQGGKRGDALHVSPHVGA